MSEVCAYIEGENLCIKKLGERDYSYCDERISINSLVEGKRYSSTIRSTNDKQNNKIILEKKFNIQGIPRTIIVCIKKNNITYYMASDNVYAKLVQVKRKVIKVGLSKRKLRIFMLAFIVNPFGFECSNANVSIGGIEDKKIKLKEYALAPNSKKVLFHNLKLISFDLNKELEYECSINNTCKVQLEIQGELTQYVLFKKEKSIKDGRKYYVPMKSIYRKHHAVQIRRSLAGTLVFVKRKKEKIEYGFKFRVLESRIMANILFLGSRIYKYSNRNKINLYFEKFASKAEEGAFDLFKLANETRSSKNYFIINEYSDDFENIKNEKNVVKQFSLKFYWLFYCADNLIATESQSQLGIIRGNNRKFRKELINKRTVFLQHGIIYLKNLGRVSPYYKGREGSCDYIVASSKKEAEVICEMLNMKESEVLITGLPIFSKVEYKHITNESEDIVTIMLTWKPYEEHLEDFTQSSYYKNTVEIYNTLQKYVQTDKINIVAHPKVEELLSETDLKDRMWKGKISEVLAETKLLITDYSSVCYNAFYQGAGVIFVHDDIALYEDANGEMIPTDAEYIGERVYEIAEISKVLDKVIDNKKIDLNQLRSRKHEEAYNTINEFNDGKNIERIYNKLIKLGLI